MKVRIHNECVLGKTLSVKREKEESQEFLRCHLALAGLFIPSASINTLCDQQPKWIEGAVFDDMGAPRMRLTLGLSDTALFISGTIRRGDGRDAHILQLRQGATISGIHLELVPLGANMKAKLTWDTAGDEADDVSELLGRACIADITIEDAGQQDMLKASQVAGAVTLATGTRVEARGADMKFPFPGAEE